MNTRIVHTLDDSIELRHRDVTLLRYVYVPDTLQRESPKPYFHPIRTLAGNVVTLFRPHDHVWHTGLAMTMAHLSGQNFWGGASYVHGQGYVQRDNNGRIEHRAWTGLRCAGDEVILDEQLVWITQAGETWLREERQIRVAEINPDEGYWTLDHSIVFENVRGQPLVFGSPTTAGRPLAGYGSLFWRGPRSFLHGQILAAGGLSGPDVMGQAAPWLAYIGRHDGNDAVSTLVFVDHPGNPRYPTKWFVREIPYACVSYSFMFDEEYTLDPGDVLVLSYRLVLADGGWTREQIDQHVAAHPFA